MSDFNAADTRAIRRLEKAARLAEAERREVVFGLMSSPAGRNYVWGQLERCHIFTSSFSTTPLAMAFAEGERNVGLQLLGDVMRFAPDQYIQMTREANDRHIATDRGQQRDHPDGGGTDSGGSDDPDGPADQFVDRDDPA